MAISLYQFMDRFPDEAVATAFFEERRWGSEPYCPHCGGINAAAVESGKPMPYRCRDCRRHFSVRTGTVLASSHVPLHKWLMAIYICVDCGQTRPLLGHGRCASCYHKYRRKMGVCARCGRERPIYAKGECKSCRDKVSREKHGRRRPSRSG